jgi:acyl carrier protein
VSKEELIRILLVSIRERTGMEISEDQFDEDLITLGVDSIRAIEIANDMEDALGILIDDREIVGFRTVNVIGDYFERVVAKAG